MVAEILVGNRSFAARETSPFIFGRRDGADVVGLDPDDMGISSVAGSIEFDVGLWWVFNLFESGRYFWSRAPVHRRFGLTLASGCLFSPRPRRWCWSPGAIYTHRMDVHIAREYASLLKVSTAPTSGTINFGEVELSERDRDALSALLCGYLRPFPFRNARPLSYQQAADLLGDPWTKTTVRKQIERLKERFTRSGLYFQGPRGNDELADHLLSTGVMSQLSLDRLKVNG